MPLLPRIINDEIAKHGPIPFARFMELALYCPECGFYETEKDNIGRGGDFYTSVSVGPLFGELLGFQFARWWEELRLGDCGLQIVEAGAHDGKLAGDILNWLRRQRPELLERTEYCILEPSLRRREWQQAALADFSAQVRWRDDFPNPQSATRDPQFTVVFANELLDALPVRRFGWDAVRRQWFEWGVTVEGAGFRWTRLTAPAPSLAQRLPSAPELLEVLPDGCVVEVNEAAEHWWRRAAGWLRCGKLVTCDYGFENEQMVLAERPRGTLRAYRHHQHVDDVLANPGEQDITAHVNFGRIEAVGRAAGLTTDLLESQERFLTRIAADAWQPTASFGAWDARRTRQFQTLTHPAHLGRSFRVLVQSRAGAGACHS